MTVTILILIDGFLQWHHTIKTRGSGKSHNPYFNRWFSAIAQRQMINAYCEYRHNPYFNRWFSAIEVIVMFKDDDGVSQSLF